jgi:hypothetical protein
MIRKKHILEGVKVNGKVVSLRQVRNGAHPNEPDTAILACLIAAADSHSCCRR